MAEWLKALAWKACIRETVSWVRIPLPPPRTQFFLSLRLFAFCFGTSRGYSGPFRRGRSGAFAQRLILGPSKPIEVPKSHLPICGAAAVSRPNGRFPPEEPDAAKRDRFKFVTSPPKGACARNPRPQGRPVPASTGHRHGDARRQGDVSDGERVRRVRARHDLGTRPRRPCAVVETSQKLGSKRIRG